ncbi:response regulator receiver domain [Microvirga roseola]|uniref:response regulator receiver domain n=1 Tax=Microvirga roseola TaxID=2883126 RepID=UPI001E4D177E|nr:response regulator receiver domain [Microvirga roseola]
MTFQQACREAAAEFLQTVVLVDDRATFGSQTDAAEATTDEADPLIEPDEMATVAVESKTAAPLPKKQGEGLDAGVITRGFAAKGLVCAVLKPEAGASLETETLQAAERADILVLDWEMDDHGQKAMEIIRGLLKSDHERGDRLRLVVIYTGISPLAPVGTQIANEVQGLSAGGEPLSLQNRTATTKVVVLGKGGAPNAPQEAGSVVDATNLPDRLIEEFAKFAGGLLPNATLGSMAHLRSNTHKLLARFNKRMDAPLITHHALLGSPKDAEQFVADLIIQELEAQIPLGRVSRTYAGLDSVKAYLEHSVAKEGAKPQILLNKDGTKAVSIELQLAQAVVEQGAPALKSHFAKFAETAQIEAKSVEKELGRDKIADKLYCLTGSSLKDGLDGHEAFAVLSSIRRSYTDVSKDDPDALPSVKLGTVVHDGTYYYLCLTPVCDSVRRAGDRANFLFARLTEEKKFNLVIEDGGTRKRLLVNRKDVHIRTFELKPSQDQTIRARWSGNHLVIDRAPPIEKGLPAEPDLRWVAEMKPMQAQRVVGSVTSNLARIGLDEFEWLRMLADNWSG